MQVAAGQLIWVQRRFLVWVGSVADAQPAKESDRLRASCSSLAHPRANPPPPFNPPQVAKECVGALAACARTGPDSLRDAAQLALTECTDDVCQGAPG